MAHITGEDRSQLLLLPDAVDDYVGPDNPVRFIDAFVDGLDLEAAGFQRVRPNDKGRPGYDPADLLKLYIYGYLNRVRSSRWLEVETHRNLEVIWLVRQLKPDFKTIADFRRDMACEWTASMCENVNMKNITVSIDDDVHRCARIKAAERGISVSAAVREFLIRWAGEETEFDRRKRLQDDTLRDIDTFRAGDRLPREETHRRGGLC